MPRSYCHLVSKRHRSTIYRKIAEGTFPRQIKIGVRGAGWRESEINRRVANPVPWRAKNEFNVLW